jgi:transposase
MIKITLSAQERRQLEGLVKTPAEGRLRIRCQAVLMAPRGRRPRHLAQDLGLTVRPRPRWLRAYQDKRLVGLKLRWRPGRRARMPAALAPEILGWIRHGPIGGGLERANWTDAELATQRYRTHGMTVSTRTMRSFCASDGVRPSGPTYHDRQADPVPQATARQERQALNNRPRREHGSGGVRMKRVLR